MSEAPPIQEQYRAQMNAVAKGLDEAFNGPGYAVNRKVCFVLLTCEFGKIDDGRVNYISNGERSDIIATLRELLARFEGRVPNLGPAPRQ